jgi:enoyl-CoA hydratase/carnithine racemase
VGLVNAVVPKADLESFVRRTAETIAANAPLTLASVKRVVRDLARAASASEDPEIARSVRACFESEDYREGVRVPRAPAAVSRSLTFSLLRPGVRVRPGLAEV